MRKPEWVRKDGFHLVGIERYTSAGPQAIRLAWDEFLDRIGEIRHSAEPQVLYGYEDYTRDFKMIPESFPQFYYLAGLEVEKAEDIPKGMASRYVPPATYALFRHEGPLSEVASVFHYIYQEWLPSSGFEMDPRVMGDFERYPIPVTDRERAVVEIH
ncbi:GyrI-like domain-containing protein, partial [Paenibacillus sepulcri]|nr:GyrI-like domain-containing protein [Paenibacillus sepulcri]